MKGCTRFSWPIKPVPMLFSAAYRHSARQVFWLSDRSTPRTFPFFQPSRKTVVLRFSSPITAAGPLPNLTGFPVRPLRHLTGFYLRQSSEFVKRYPIAREDKKVDLSSETRNTVTSTIKTDQQTIRPFAPKNGWNRKKSKMCLFSSSPR